MPKRALAFVAALVQVTNTTANPVANQDVVNAARKVFRLTGELPLPGTKVTTGSLGRPSRFSQWLPHSHRIFRGCLQLTAAASFRWWNFGRQPKPRG
jgi:hypothetical protein